MRRWQDYEATNKYYYDDADGMIIGQIHKFGTSVSIYTATVKPDNIDKLLGQYVNVDYAQKAVENFWLIQDRTLIE
jgi:hypothetical protein